MHLTEFSPNFLFIHVIPFIKCWFSKIQHLLSFPHKKRHKLRKTAWNSSPKRFLKQKQLFHSYKPVIRCCEGWSKHTLLVKQGFLWNVNMNPLWGDYNENRVHHPPDLCSNTFSCFLFVLGCLHDFSSKKKANLNEKYYQISTSIIIKVVNNRRFYTIISDCSSILEGFLN